jgi:hypothetical protein
MEGVNSFDKGLHQSNSPQEQPEGSYVDALNWIRNDSGRLINEDLEEVVQTFPNYTLLGYTPTNDEFICFFKVGTNSEIGIFNRSTTPKYKTVFNDKNHSYKLDFKNSIDCIARIVSLATDPASSGDLVVYFVEEANPMRRFNISQYNINPSIYNTIEDFNLLLQFTMPYCTLDIKETGGSLSSGVYSIALRYRTAENNQTICNIPTKFISIIDENPTDLASFNWTGRFSDFFDGCAPETGTSKSIEITTLHVDTNYPYIEPIIITYTGIANNLVIKSLGIYDNIEGNKILFSSLNQLKDDVPTTEITEIALFYDTAKCIEQKDNVLILSNLTTKKYDDSFQKIANNIELYWEIQTYNLQSPRAISSFKKQTINPSLDWDYTNSSGELPTGRKDQDVIDRTDYWQSNIYHDPTVKKGFQRGEVYSFSITPIYKDGSVGFAYHIPGKTANGTNRLKAWVSSNNYPDYMKKYNINSNNKIQHHQMPDLDDTLRIGGHNYGVNSVYINSEINVLRVKAKNINFGVLKDSIQGYIIGYQQRNDDTNTRIIDYGFVRPYLKLDGVDQYRNGMFSGSAMYRTEFNNWRSEGAIQAKSPYGMYHSADTTFLDREIKSSYSIEKIGYAINGVPNYNTDTGIGLKLYLTQNLFINLVDKNGVYLDGRKISGDTRTEPAYQDWVWTREVYTPLNIITFPPKTSVQTTDNPFAVNLNIRSLNTNTVYTKVRYCLYVRNGASVPVGQFVLVDVKTLPIVISSSKTIEAIATNEYWRLWYSSTSSPHYGFEGSGTDVIVYEGTSRLNYDAVGTSNGTWRITSVTSSNITIPSPSIELETASGKNFARYGDFSNLTTANDTLNYIKINIAGKKTNGTAFTTSVQLIRTRIKKTSTVSVPAKYFPIDSLSDYKLEIGRFNSDTTTDTNIIVFQDGTTPIFTPQTYYSRLPLLVYKNETNAQKAEGFLFFEESNFIPAKGNLEKIKNAKLIPNVYDSEGVTRIGSNIQLNQCNAFWHIEIGSSNGIIQDSTNYQKSLFETRQIYYGQVENDNGNLDEFQIHKLSVTLAIARIVNDINFQYGPLNSAEYVPTLTRFDDQNLNILNNDSLELEGDTYICKTFIRRYDTFQSDGKNDGASNTDQSFQAQMLIGFYSESRNNLTLRYKETSGAEYYPKNRVIYTNDPNNLGIMNRELHTITFPYNKQYSAINNVKVNITIPTFFKEVTNYPNRSIFSYGSFESDLVDKYRLFPTNQFHDIPKDRGVIKDTFVFNNNFYHHTEYGLWLSYFNPNTTQATSQGEIVLGNGGIFKIPSKLVLDIKGGYMGTKDKSGTNTPFGRVFLDHYQSKIFLFSGEGPIEISDLGLFSFFRGFVNTTDKYSMGYDWANKRLLISNISKGRAISFYPKTQTWTSLHNFAPTAYLTLNGASYAWQDSSSSFYNLNNSSGIRKNSYITFVENTQPDAFKRFDRIEMNTMSGGVGGKLAPGSVLDTGSYEFKDQSFTHIHTWTDRQNSTELAFAYSHDYNTNFLNSYDNTKVPVNYYQSSFHAELPLDAVVDPYKNIFDVINNTDINGDFRSHMKGKFLYTKLSYNSQDPLVLNYVKTFFKPTVA